MRDRRERAEKLRAIDYEELTYGTYVDEMERAVGTYGTADLLHEVLADLIEPQLPEGVEWPRFEDGELVKVGDEVEYGGETMRVCSVTFVANGWSLRCERRGVDGVLYGSFGERVKRPAPKVLDADGVPIEVGDVVWATYDGCKHIVMAVCSDGSLHPKMVTDDGCMVEYEEGLWDFAKKVTHKRPDSLERIARDIEDFAVDNEINGDHEVFDRAMDFADRIDSEMAENERLKKENAELKAELADWKGNAEGFQPDAYMKLPVDADGAAIHVGDVLYSSGNECRVVSITVKADEACVGVHTDEGAFLPSVNPKYLSRKKPEPADSWEKLEEDARKTACDYAPAPHDEDGLTKCYGCPFQKSESCSNEMTIDLVERAKKLAGIEEEAQR